MSVVSSTPERKDGGNPVRRHASPVIAGKQSVRSIYIAVPWTPVGGGMFKVADYLIQAQAPLTSPDFARLRPLDTRGASNAVWSLWVLAKALMRLLCGRLSGGVVGVHVNMAECLSLFRKGVVVVVCRALRLPVVLHLHAAQLHHHYERMSRKSQALTRWVFSLPAACVVLGTESRRFVVERLGVDPSRVEIVINGVPEPTVPRRMPGAGQDQRVLFIGNLSERKGISDLLKALALPGLARPNLRVSIAGGGDVDLYREQARRLNVGHFVTFEGWADQSKAARLLAAADVLILPSYDEGLPLVILEALANGVAVVCTPVGEIPRVFTDQINACFVRAGDPQSIADGLCRVLDDAELRRTLELNGRRIYEQQFSLSQFFDRIAAIHMKHFGACAEPDKPAGP